MSTSNDGRTNETHIHGAITGQVHTGSGDIKVDHFSALAAISTKADFLAALREFRVEMEIATRQGLPDGTAEHVIKEVNEGAHEAEKDKPDASEIVKRLERAQGILKATGGVVAAAVTTEGSLQKLVPFLETLIHHAQQLFS